ncbi:MAG TPA: biotin--[acetyl-CoA-carboxylase] ligase [Terricaulis sp.]|nr:biotin--[acetyl-CoA-carboxylase] ligase [Terricaulis sp.]
MIDGQAPVEIFDEIDSTLSEARRRAERGDFAPVWLVAKVQTAGRGRRGRAWRSLDGNLLATYFSRNDRPPAEIALLGFALAVAIAETFDTYLGARRALVKWPNDVLIDGAKMSGILLDSGAAHGAGWAALGFGVNLAAAPEGLDQPTACLRQLLPPDALASEPLAFLDELRPRLEQLGAQLAQQGFAPLRQAWLSRAYGLGQIARVAQGETVLEGRIAGLSETGALELDTSEGRKLVAAGDVYFSGAS